MLASLAAGFSSLESLGLVRYIHLKRQHERLPCSDERVKFKEIEFSGHTGKRSLLGAPTIYLRGPAIAVTPSGPEDERQTRDAAWEKASGPDLGCPG